MYGQHFRYIERQMGIDVPAGVKVMARTLRLISPAEDAELVQRKLIKIARFVDRLQEKEGHEANFVACRTLVQRDPRYQGISWENQYREGRRYLDFEYFGVGQSPRFYFYPDAETPIASNQVSAIFAAAAWIRANPPTQEQIEQRIADSRLVRQQEGLDQ